jgi:hypothetical protein
LGIKGGYRGNNMGFGNLCNLKPVISTADNNSIINKIPKPTRTIRISEQLFRRFVGFSQRYYNVEPYETILEDLIKSYEEHNEPDFQWNKS